MDEGPTPDVIDYLKPITDKNVVEDVHTRAA